jgi:hypothetical protein
LLLYLLYQNGFAPASIQVMADAARPACILETRKTAPGLRLVDKWAVSIPCFVRGHFITISFFSFPSVAIFLTLDIHLGVNWWREESQAWFI